MSPNTRKISTIVGSVAVVVLGWLGWSYYQSFQTITLTYSKDIVTGLAMYQADSHGKATGKAVKTVASGQPFKLRNGSYVAVPSGTKASTEPIPVVIDGVSLTKNLTVNYSTSYLVTLLTAEEPTITAALYASSPQLAKLYRPNATALYHQGDWYGAALTYIGTVNLSRDTLHIVMHKEGGVWKIAANPEIVLSANQYPNIPHDVLSTVNAIDLGVPANR